MKLALAIAAQNEAHWLKLHLLSLHQRVAKFDCVAVLDGGSTDDTIYVARGFGALIFRRAFDWNFSAHMNALIDACEQMGADAILRLDPDEMMFSEDIARVRDAFDAGAKVLRFPRYNFVGDRMRYSPMRYPDYQTRAFILNHGIRYSGMPVHETIELSLKSLGWLEAPETQFFDGHIYHYGLIAPHDARFWLKHHNYFRLSRGEEPLLEPPDNLDLPIFHPKAANVNPSVHEAMAEAFTGLQPIDPRECGLRAPFNEEDY